MAQGPFQQQSQLDASALARNNNKPDVKHCPVNTLCVGG